MSSLALRTIFTIISSLMLAILLSVPASAQTDPAKDSLDNQQQQVDDILKQIKGEMQNSPTFPDSILSPPTLAQQQLFDDSTMAIYKEAMYAYYEYRVSGFKHRKEVFAWQLFSSKLIFWSVLLLVISGISFSGIQFYKSIKNQREDGTGSENNVTEFEASATGIKVTSPVLGVIILVISLAFFYLYLVYVYPISEIF